MTTTKSTKLAFLGGARLKKPLALAFTLILATLACSVAPALAAAEPHPQIGEFGSFTNPNGIAIDEASGDVYVADIATNTVSKFDASGAPVNFDFPAGSKEAPGNTLKGADAPAESFSFPSVYGSPAAIAVDNACVRQTPALIGNACKEFDPSAGDLYVMDAGHGVIDKFGPGGEYLSQIAGFEPATGTAKHELLGIAVDSNGTVRADVSGVTARVRYAGGVSVEEFDDSAANHLIAQQHANEPSEHLSGIPQALPGDGFAVGPSGDDYMLFKQGNASPCSCTAKLGQQLAALGLIDNYGSGDVAIAADAATGHLYVDDQSSVAEWDNGAVNGAKFIPNSFEEEGAGTLVSRFGEGRLSGSSGQGGIAVNGATGEIYVSNPADGKVYVFGSDAPAVSAGAPTNVTKESATLNGTVNPRGEALRSCEIEYSGADEFGQVSGEHYEHGEISCEPTQIGSGTSAVPVKANIEGLEPGLLYRFRIVATNAAGTSQSAGLLATKGLGFGLSRFELSFVREDGSPDVQAGSHPYEMRNNMEFNAHFVRAESNADSMYLREPDGTLRDLTVDLPPGLVGDPNATAKKCTLSNLLEERRAEVEGGGCPSESLLGQLELNWDSHVFGYDEFIDPVYNMVPPRGDAAQFGVNYGIKTEIFISSSPLAGGDYPIQATVVGAPPEAPVIRSQLTIKGVIVPCVAVPAREGVPHGKYQDKACTQPARVENGLPTGAYELEPGRSKAFLTLPTACNGPLRTTIALDSYEEPGHWVHSEALTKNLAGVPLRLSGCSDLQFPPTITVSPDTTDASTSSGLTVGVHVPQTAGVNPAGLAESSLRDTTVALPEGVAINPSGGDGLEACSSNPGALGEGALGSPGDQIGYKGQEELNAEYEPGVKWDTFTPELASPLAPGSDFCPNGSKIGTVKIKTPLLEHELEGAVYLATQDANPFESLIAMYLVVEDPYSGTLIKLAGEVTLNPDTGQIVTTFKNTPDLPFENLELHFFGGERSPLATPSRCGTYTTTAVFTPWDGNGPVTAESSFEIEHGPGGGPCPGATLPFDPTVNAGATNIQAGAFSPLTVTVNRHDGEQNLKSLEAKLPPGLSGVLTGVELCPEPQANEGRCGEASKVGEATISVGVGNDPFTVTGGRFYLTGPYNGHGSCTVGEAGCAPFGLTFEVPAKAGPFDLANTANNHPACDCVVVRGKIELNPQTSAITITSNPPGTPDSIPTSIEGIPLEIQHINATTTRGNFQFNPTNCDKMSLTGTVQLNEGGSSTITTPFQVTNCAALKFEPKFSVSTSAKTSRTKGASLTAKLTYPSVPQGTDADIAKVKVELPKQLPSRLTTLQKACSSAQFESNPAACPAASKIGYAVVHTPLIPVPLQGPTIFVSHGGEGWPSLVLVLQGYGITIDLTGSTLIKNGITSTTFKTVPDEPFSSFELTLPEGPYSALTAIANLCTAKTLTMPTEFIAQNGAELKQTTKIAVTGCPKHKKATHKKHKTKHRRLKRA